MGHAYDARDRCNVTDKIIVEFFKQCCVDRGSTTDNEESIAVCGCPHDRLNTDIAASARTILNEELLAEALRQQLTYQARRDVVHATGGKGDNDACRPCRKGLRPRDARDCRQRGSARGQIQKSTAGKFHGAPKILLVQIFHRAAKLTRDPSAKKYTASCAAGSEFVLIKSSQRFA